MKYARSGDTHIAYDVIGDGPVDLLLMSRSYIPIDMIRSEPFYARCVDALASFSRVILHDRRGIGMSDPVSAASPPTLTQAIDDVLAVMDAAGAARPVVVGPGEGGQIAISLATRHPDRLSALVLVNASARLRQAADYLFGYTPRDVEQLMGGSVEHDGDEQEFDFFPVVAPTEADNPQFRSWWEEAGHRGASPWVAAAMSELFLDADVRHDLRSIGAPTLVLHRVGDRMIPPVHGRYLAEHIPGAVFVELPGADDLWWIGGGEAVVDEIQYFVTGTRGAAESTQTVMTVLFTDIARSTELAGSLGDRLWRRLLDDHDVMVRRELRRFGGQEISTTGDGFLVTFAEPDDAVAAALAVCQGARGIGLEVRCGIHTGDVERRGRDLLGITVHIAARINALASASEVFVSMPVMERSTAPGVKFVELGSFELKGVARAMELYTAIATQ
jgi:class 3 adenylate cyclase/pimeloyl-ACP methyl ester carboxylesterase